MILRVGIGVNAWIRRWRPVLVESDGHDLGGIELDQFEGTDDEAKNPVGPLEVPLVVPLEKHGPAVGSGEFEPIPMPEGQRCLKSG